MGRIRSSSRFPPGTNNPRQGQSISQPCKPARCCPHSSPAVLPSYPHSHPIAPPSARSLLSALDTSSSCCALTFRKSSWIAPHFTGLPLPERSRRPAHPPASMLLFNLVSSVQRITLECLPGPEHSDGKVLASHTGGALVTETPPSSLLSRPGDNAGPPPLLAHQRQRKPSRRGTWRPSR